MKFIYTCDDSTKELALQEILQYDKNFKFERWLDKRGVFIGYSRFKSYELKTLIEKTPILFIRHIFKVDGVFENTEDIINLIFEAAVKSLEKDKTFSVQLRSSSIENSALLMKDLSTRLEESKFILDVKNPQKVISIFVTEDKTYFGIDAVECNLSKYKGGEPHYAKDNNFISRSEYKLLELLDLAKIDLSICKTAADFGSAPGGWSNVLAGKGIFVYAIDPAYLDEKVSNRSLIEHYQMTIQEFYRRYPTVKFDLIVNDMKMDINSSIEIVKNFSSRLIDKGYVVMTFKLPERYTYTLVRESLDLLLKRYKLVFARQLFHNRNEITVVVQK